MNNVLKFSVNNIELVDKIEKSLFRKVKIKAFATGENAHTLPIEEDVLKRGARTVYNKPILWKYNKYFDDAEGHEKDEVPCGFVPESKDNPIEFENVNGKIYIVISALLWTRYCGRLIDIFKRDDMKKDVSIEIAYIEDEDNSDVKPKIQDFVVAGITILGEMINPACKGCEAELLEFSENKERYLTEMMSDNKSIIIDNTKEASVDGVWSNPRRKLFTPISKASNRKALLKEAYLIGDFDADEPEITNFKYPHHVIRNGKLVVHRSGLQAAFQRAAQQGIVKGEVKSHLLRHYRELGLSTENFSEFAMSEEDFTLYFAEDLKESVGEETMTEENKELIEESEGDKLDVVSKEEIVEDKPEEISEEVIEESEDKAEDVSEDEKPEDKSKEMCDIPSPDINCEDEPEGDEPEDVSDDGDEDEEHDDSHEEEVEEHKDEEEIEERDEEMSCDALKEEMCKMQDKIRDLEEKNAAYMTQIEAMSDYEELKKFKADTEERIAREKEMADMEKVMCDIEARGINMSEEDKNEFKAKIKEFASIDAWSNYVKAQAFDRAESIDGIVRIGLPYITDKPQPKSIWDEI